MGKDTIPGPFEAYCEATRHSPAPLPEEVAADLEEATKVLRKVQEVLRNEDLLFAAEGLRCVFHVLSRHASQARRLAEVEAELIKERSLCTEYYEQRNETLARAKAAEARVRELEANRGHDTLAIAELVEIGVLCGLDMTSVEIADVLPAVKSVLAVTEASA